MEPLEADLDRARARVRELELLVDKLRAESAMARAGASEGLRRAVHAEGMMRQAEDAAAVERVRGDGERRRADALAQQLEALRRRPAARIARRCRSGLGRLRTRTS